MNDNVINIIGLAGSPRANSNSTALLDELLKGAKDNGASCQIFTLADMNIKLCCHCDYCIENDKCIYNDDMTELYQNIKQADIIAVSSPIYFMGLSSQLKVMVDRCQMFWSYRNANKVSLITGNTKGSKRKGVFIATGARNTESVFAGVNTTMRWLFDAIDCEFTDSIYVGNCENPGDIKSTPEYLTRAYELGKKLATQVL